MKTLDKGTDKIKRIADSIRQEVLEPARKDAEDIIGEAKAKAEGIIKEAEAQAGKLLENARQAIEHERNVFHSSLTQAAKQTVEALKQSIEKKLFNEELEALVAKQTTDPQVIANLITVIVKAVEKEGLSTDISAIIPKEIPPQQINQLLAKDVLNKLQGQSVAVGEFAGGAQVQLVDRKLTLDVTDETLVDYLRTYVRKDFRKLIFAG